MLQMNGEVQRNLVIFLMTNTAFQFVYQDFGRYLFDVELKDRVR